MIWNPVAIDYSAGIDIVDCVTGTTYSEEQAKNLPIEIRQRLLNKPRKIGCWVLTIEECKEILLRRGGKENGS